MNAKIPFLTFVLSSCIAMTGVAAAHTSSPSPQESTTTQSVHSVITINDNDNTLVITRDNGEMTVQLNGREVPSDRIERDGDWLRVLDDDGGVLFEAQLLSPLPALRGRGELPRRAAAREAAERRGMEFREFAMANRPRAQMGVMLGRVDDALAAQLGVNPDEVVLIAEVMEGLAADRAGVKRHDIVVEVDGQAPVTTQQLREIVLSKEPNEIVRVKVLREGKTREIDIQLHPVRGGLGDSSRPGDATWRQLDEEVRRSLHERLMGEWRQHLQDRPDLARELRLQAERLRPIVVHGLRHLRRDTAEVIEEVRESLHVELSKLQELLENKDLQRKLEEAIEKALEHASAALDEFETELEELAPHIEFFQHDGARRGMLIHPTSPAPPVVEDQRRLDRDAMRRSDTPRPRADRNRDAGSDRMENRFNQLEERLERLEKMIQQLVEQRQRQNT